MSEEKFPTLDEHIAMSQANTDSLVEMRKAYPDVIPIGSGRYASQAAADAGDLDQHERVDAEVFMFRKFGGYKLESPQGRVSLESFFEQYKKDPSRPPTEVIAAVHAEMAAEAAKER